MERPAKSVRQKLTGLLAEWEKSGMPPRNGLAAAAEETIRWRRKNGAAGLWKACPVFVTATIDDGWGNGLHLIQRWAEAAGMEVRPMGLLKTPEEIIRKCRRLKPEFLGMTILQFDSEDDVIEITNNLPEKTRLIAGGPLFRADPDLAGRMGVHFAAKNAAEFIAYLLTYEQKAPAGEN